MTFDTRKDAASRLNASGVPDKPAATLSEALQSHHRRGFEADVFDPRLFRDSAEIAIAKLESYLADSSIRGLALTDPAVLLRAAKDLMAGESEGMASLNKERLSAIIDLYIKTGIQVHSPGAMGHQFSGTLPWAGVFDLIGAIVNQPSSFYEAGQLPNVAERLMADEFNRFIGWEVGRFAMVTTSGGSLGNLTALLAARNDQFPRLWSEGISAMADPARPAIAVSEDAHYSVCRAAGIMGIGEQQIVRLPVNRKRQICPAKARSALDAAAARGLKVFCLVAAAGTTSVGAFDPIDALADIAQENNIWLHIDGAHGASLLISDALRHKLQGIERADSFIWDAHKLLFMPPVCTLLFYKNKEKSLGAFHQEASYVFEKEPDIYTEFDSADKNFECTKRPLIMNLWATWALHGRTPFADRIESLCQLAAHAYRVLGETPDFVALHQPEANILCFRYLPADARAQDYPDFQTALRNRIREKGKFFISKVDIEGLAALRVVFMNQRMNIDHFRMLLDEIRKTAEDLLNS